jgi:hypothetical protein
MARCKVVMRDGENVAAPGWGRQVKARMPPPAVKNADRTTRTTTDPTLRNDQTSAALTG